MKMKRSAIRGLMIARGVCNARRMRFFKIPVRLPTSHVILFKTTWCHLSLTRGQNNNEMDVGTEL